MPNFEYLVTKLVMDEAFADYFHKDQAGALQSIGITPNAALLNALAQVDFNAISQVANLMPHQSKIAN
jgi:hypothetical protein